ncbi:MAG: serine protease [Candidatus Magasanikbacteria bacterium]|nr:serine protease [Candidatus Magasanikbacteria bacterium]
MNILKSAKKLTAAIAPHLPKEVRQKGIGVMFWHLPTTKAFLITVLFGFFSGVVGGMVVNSSPFDEWLWGPNSPINSRNRNVESGAGRVLPRDVLAKKSAGSLAVFYRQSAVAGKAILPRPEDALGVGFFITSDGWLATARSVVNKINKNDLAVVSFDNQVSAVDMIVFDPISDITLVKVKGGNSNSLPFVLNDYYDTGATLFIPSVSAGMEQSELLLNNYFFAKSKNDYYRSSERLYRFGLLNKLFEKKMFGSPVITSKDEIAGVLVGENTFVRASLIDSALKSVVKLKEIERVYLGVRFVEAGALIGLSKNQDTGVKLTVLEKNSPLLPLGLLAGDILVSINNENITPLRSLPDILADYQSGTQVEVKYARDGVEKTVVAELGKIK